ncbi:CAT8 [Candida metapsilosis]|uniref:CAT8 n=1 Tax=Candida metapsilosis TaxID=273372 RepID=A0A8H8D8X3_9ASCO|nr:CAT8 [Candida metapsilosis]
MSIQTVKQEPQHSHTIGPYSDHLVQDDQLPEKKQKSSKKGARTNLKTIRAPGSRSNRVAQACDRCRAKKTKCDGGDPCSTCSAVGLKCIVSDKLSRKAFPKGYTETLEERVRHLEAEVKKLVGILDMRDEQLELLGGTKSNTILTEHNTGTDSKHDHEITTSNLTLLDAQNQMHLHMHDANGCSCGCDHSHAVHERPVSVAGSLYEAPPISVASSAKLSDDKEDFDTNSLLSLDDVPNAPVPRERHHFASNSTNRDSTPAPGAFAAATAIAQMHRKRLYEQQQEQHSETSKQRMLTSLVATSLPRSTEETLCVPALLARICQAYGYDSKPAILAANALATLKDRTTHRTPFGQEIPDRLSALLMDREDVIKLGSDDVVVFLRDVVHFPSSRLDIDQLMTVYFQQWGNVMPILDKAAFLKSYMRVMQIMEMGSAPEDDGLFPESIEKVAALMVLLLSMGLLSSKNVYLKSENAQNYIFLMKHYDMLIHEFIKPNCLITKHCSIQSLQVLSLALQYCLAIGDISTCYDLRGRVISMAQQLRLHRCPAAILGLDVNGKDNLNSQNFMQGERRILFWCIYCLDTYCSLNLGVPRLMKDYEIECAMPFSGKGNEEGDSDNSEEDDNVNILIVNNTELTIVGKVSKMALSVMLFCKVLASILDSIYSRFDNGEDAYRKALHKDRMLDCWRRELPAELKFDVDVSGLSLSTTDTKYYQGSIWENCNTQQLTLIYLYYHAKILIYLPIISKYGKHHNVGLSQKEQMSKGESDTTTIVSTMSLVQQSSSQILQIVRSSATSSNSSVLPIPVNIAREQSLLTLLVAKGTLDYIKGGPLFNNSKQLLLDSVSAIAKDAKYETPDSLNRNSVKLVELSVMSILGINLNKFSDNLKKKTSTIPIQKTAVEREPKFANSKPCNSFISNMKQQQNTELAYQKVNPNVEISTNLQANPEIDAYGNLDDLESLLKFDPFSINVHDPMHMNEFVTDGSLGFGPYLELPNTGNISFDNAQIFNNFNGNNYSS